MAIEEKDVSKLFTILSHSLRRDILQLLNEKGELSFTDLMSALEVDTGTLSFHLRNLKTFLEQTPHGKYKLNRFGNSALRLIKDGEAITIEADFVEKQSFLRIASIRKRIGAFLVDLAIAFVITVATSLVANLDLLFTGTFNPQLNIITFIVLLWLYSTLMEGYSGQTLGKAFLHLKAVTITEKKLSYDSAAVRNFGKAFLLPIDLLIGFRIKDKRFIRYFDKFSGTTVIDITMQNSSTNKSD
jgi:uncharacterized RDD family membrane protein YckC